MSPQCPPTPSLPRPQHLTLMRKKFSSESNLCGPEDTGWFPSQPITPTTTSPATNVTASAISAPPVLSINAPTAWCGNPDTPNPTAPNVTKPLPHPPLLPQCHPQTALQVLLDRLPVGSLPHIVGDLIKGHMALPFSPTTPTLTVTSPSTKELRIT
jgi:hypothetical protein